jgi:pantetheine-phosphate adenylyltransferase
MKEKIALFPGSFDPFTIGHESIVQRGLSIFDKIIIGIGVNNSKRHFLDIEKRIKIIKKVFATEDRIEIKTYSGLTVDFCKNVKADYLLRGLRTSADFEFERAIGQTNKRLKPEIETIFLLTLPEHSYISSSIVKDVIINGGNLEGFLPSNTKKSDFI